MAVDVEVEEVGMRRPLSKDLADLPRILAG